MTVVFYISGHGLGHASRDIEVINRLLARRPGIRIVIRSSAPTWFFDTFVRGPFELRPGEVDTGVAQIDSLRLDEDETALQAARYYGTFEERVDAEAQTLKALGASVVVSDVPPLGIAAAARADIPSILLGNFTWDWIYQDYPDFERFAPGVIGTIGAAYAHAGLALRLPFHGGFATIDHVTRDISLVARRARRSPSDIRAALNLPRHGSGHATSGSEMVVLASFGGYGLDVPYEDIADSNRFTLLVTEREMPGAVQRRSNAGNDRIRRFEISALAAQGIYYPDLVAACDVVVSKPGYGIVSECIANGAALLYTDRGRFPEHQVFVAEMPRVMRCRFIAQDDLLTGRWNDAVEALLEQPPPAERIASDGADAAARIILNES
jgi:L-arabinokinase